MSPEAALKLYEELRAIAANHHGTPACGQLMAGAVAIHSGQFTVTIDSPRSRARMIEHFRGFLAAMEKGAPIVSGGVMGLNPHHIMGNLQLGAVP